VVRRIVLHELAHEVGGDDALVFRSLDTRDVTAESFARVMIVGTDTSMVCFSLNTSRTAE